MPLYVVECWLHIGQAMTRHDSVLRGSPDAMWLQVPEFARWLLLLIVRLVVSSLMTVRVSFLRVTFLRLMAVGLMWQLKAPAASVRWLSASSPSGQLPWQLHWSSWQLPWQLHGPPLPLVALQQLLHCSPPASARGAGANCPSMTLHRLNSVCLPKKTFSKQKTCTSPLPLSARSPYEAFNNYIDC